ncbi:MAG: hypothetical protein ACI85I_002935 [Arenicella sp.]|jgi:hypothetical protein
MKSIENFHLNNMALVHKYLSGEMSAHERASFEMKMEEDEELKEDFEIAQEYLASQKGRKKTFSSREIKKLTSHNFDQIRLDRKALVGRDLITYGIGIVAFGLLLLSVCVLILGWLS